MEEKTFVMLSNRKRESLSEPFSGSPGERSYCVGKTATASDTTTATACSLPMSEREEAPRAHCRP